jgi:predicted RNA-binding Zn ribbon-like protein
VRIGEPLAELNAALADALVHLRLVPGKRRAGPLAWAWDDDDDSLDALLHPVVRAAGDLLSSDEAALIRVCAGVNCGWLYVDRSRNKLRRWCEMGTCGTDEKTRRRRKGKG